MAQAKFKYLEYTQENLNLCTYNPSEDQIFYLDKCKSKFYKSRMFEFNVRFRIKSLLVEHGSADAYLEGARL